MFAAGDPADRMVVVLEGELQARLEGPDETSFTTYAGSVSGILPYSRMTIFPANGRAVQPSRSSHFSRTQFNDLLDHMPELGRRLVATMVDRTREITRMEQQRDRLAALGKLSAGLAHELNNPAAAARRTAERLRGVVGEFRASVSKLEDIQLTEGRRPPSKPSNRHVAPAEPETDVLKASQLQDEIEAILHQHGIANSWQYASSLVESGLATGAAQIDAGRGATGTSRAGAEASLGHCRRSTTF